MCTCGMPDMCTQCLRAEGQCTYHKTLVPILHACVYDHYFVLTEADLHVNDWPWLL